MTTQILTAGTPDALWLSVNPSFRRLEQQLLLPLNRQVGQVAHWGYAQTPDEPSDLEVALTLLHDYLKGCDRPVHLIGHSTGGLVGLLYARRYPERVKSLTLLGVGVNPTLDWKANYYAQLDLLPCSRTRLLTQMVHRLFGQQHRRYLHGLRELLERDLIESLSLHSPLERFSLFPGGVAVPLLVAGGQADSIVDPVQVQGWYPWFKPGDRLWLCPHSRHFFYATHADATATEIVDFWQTVEGHNIAPPLLRSA
ncbi:alpha/beta fold hydrolase [Leptolyngbya iicbica]|uniref:Alpha/beta hydrolase n=2 Tax=Cyanophyceae TaxID=3028117 RepID=A0A4Q7EAF3_9CYAN|nr:alpha/beta hydrolase [Leptolyngbya sp. LK]RZM79459.1 alpha/beta hydrolase [Leptolyngbya sp. LK]